MFETNRALMAHGVYKLFRDKIKRNTPNITKKSKRKEIEYMCECFKNCILLEFQEDESFNKDHE